MQELIVIVVLLAIMGAIVGGTWYWLAKAVKEQPNDLPILGDKSWEKASDAKRDQVLSAGRAKALDKDRAGK